MKALEVPFPHDFEQHDVSHCPELQVVPSIVPAGSQPPIPLMWLSWQVPFWFVPTLVHLPVQHSALVKQVSLICRQKDASAEHLPLTHAFEQHSLFEPQVFPDPLQTPPLIAWQLPLWHLPLQHCPFVAHAPRSPTQAFTWQVRFEPQNPEQQSALVRHACPGV